MVIDDSDNVVGLVEYKAPYYGIYDPARHPYGIPRKYMCQMQVCDFRSRGSGAVLHHQL